MSNSDPPLPRHRRRRHLSLRHPRDPRPPALPPGSLVHVGEQRVKEVTFRVLDYDADHVRELQTGSVPDCVEFEGRDSPVWIMVTGLHDVAKIGELLEAYGI